MQTSITKGIRVSAEATYRPQQSSSSEGRYVFSYEIIIENRSEETVQLLRRHWYVFDSVGRREEVEGEGVIGVQPILSPGEKFKYQSWCPLFSELGKMHGTFLMEEQVSGKQFNVHIPEFILTSPTKMN
ncbi:MAG TPA: Co2+/Mg2+ efflux protein ApaG [Phaeodactylibacter sp.]|nr:Co2+/Mg2+ efflux protein ApaG [Phaeodactylibacter sp.]